MHIILIIYFFFSSDEDHEYNVSKLYKPKHLRTLEHINIEHN